MGVVGDRVVCGLQQVKQEFIAVVVARRWWEVTFEGPRAVYIICILCV